VYRKPTHTWRVAPPFTTKIVCNQLTCTQSFHYLWHRTSTDRLNHLKLALQKNRHDKKNIIKTINKHANKTMISDTIRRKNPIHSPIYQRNNRSDWQDNILNKHNIRTIYKPAKKIGQILRNSKDLHSALQEYTKYLVPMVSIHWRNRENDQPMDKRIPT